MTDRRAIIRGSGVYLRYPAASDRAEFLRLHRASRGFLAPWEGTTPNGPRPTTTAVFQRMLRSRRTAQSRRFIVCRVQDGAIMGQIGLGGIIRGSFQSAFVGYWIGKPFARQGHMTEALTLALSHAFRELALHRVEANIVPSNRASISLVKRLGFRYEGTALRYLHINGRWQDHQRWAMTADE